MKRRGPVRSLSAIARFGLIIAGVAGIGAGVALLTAGSKTNAERLGRVAGILIIVGLACCGFGVAGRF